MIDIPYEIGALYNRKKEIHDVFGGQRQGGISTPKANPVVIIFTGEAGKAHGYQDFWDDDGVFHYFGEGQSGDMTYTGGNRAILRHDIDGKQLILFQMMGHGKPYRYLGEFKLLDPYEMKGISDTSGSLRTAMVFRLRPVDKGLSPFESGVKEPTHEEISVGSTVALQLTEIRKKQTLFRRRLIGVEKECRLTGIRDLRFLRASHIKPWASCATGDERVDGNNGLLLSPHADLLFDRGWITFEEQGKLVRASELPSDVVKRLGLSLRAGRACGPFSDKQQAYLEFHRNKIFEKRFTKFADPVDDLINTLATQE